LPEFKSAFSQRSTHKKGLGNALVHRARHAVAKDECARFRQTHWLPFFTSVRDAVDGDRELTTSQRYAAHEEVVRCLVSGCPGVYVNVCPDSGWFYLGESDDMARRNDGHRNGGMFLARAFVTGDKKTAVSLQNSLFRKLEETGLIRQRRFPAAPVRPSRWIETRQGSGRSTIIGRGRGPTLPGIL
jgi:hypothetical protein